MEQLKERTPDHAVPVRRPEQKARGPAQPSAPESPPANDRKPGFKLYLKAAGEWSRIHLRRWAHLLHGAAAGNLAVGPVSFLLVAGALGAALTLTTLYSTSYAVIIDGREVGVVADQDVVDHAIQTVQTRGSELLGYDYHVEGNIDYSFALTLKSDLSREQDIRDYFYSQLNEVSDQLRAYQVLVDGRVIGVVKDEQSLNTMLDGIKAEYVTENTTDSGFVEDVSIHPVYAADELMTVSDMEQALRNDMSLSDLMSLNPDASINRLMVGDVLNVKEIIPTLSVQTTEHVTYSQPIQCPVEEVPDDSMYRGDSKILTQGEEGEALVEADVIYVNGRERGRDVTNTTTLREPTTTVKAVGTKEKPKTASKGYFIWPTSSRRINSYFGGRNLWGRYDYHSGLDIHATYGEGIKAADGGTVTYAGWQGSYGNLVIITHDSGIKTYYAHNSSLLVSVGQKVYQGQAIAKAGSTGRSSGVHCHFEVRIRGTAVNPLNYLK